MGNEMLPCPFCGAHAVLRSSMAMTEIICSGSSHGGCAVQPSVIRTNFKEAQLAWNFRYNDKESSDG
jgi:hypothetical protein